MTLWLLLSSSLTGLPSLTRYGALKYREDERKSFSSVSSVMSKDQMSRTQ